VQAGLRTADAVQIVEGLKPGEELITSGILQLRPGMTVQVRRIENRPDQAVPAIPAKSVPTPIPAGVPRE